MKKKKVKKANLILILLILFAAFVCTSGVASAISLSDKYVGNTVVDLEWTKYWHEDFSCYKLYRSGSTIATISDRDTTFYYDAGLSKGVTYNYKIEVYDTTGKLIPWETYTREIRTGWVHGTITRDTTWTAATSPYSLSSTVYVAKDTTLTIGSGVTVNSEYGRPSVEVYGTLSSESATFDAVIIHGDRDRGFRYLSLRDCLFNDGYLNLNGNDSSVIGNTLTNGDGYNPTIRVWYGNNNTIKDNILINTTHGISLMNECNHNMVAGNTLSGSGVEISLYRAYNNMIMGNIVSNASSIGISGGAYNTVAGNIISNSGGICINSENNIIKDNIVSNNSYYGIRVDGDYNTIYNNYFDNEDNACDQGWSNIWNITKTPGTNIVGGPYLGGNYWSDYAGTDADGDGFGDTPYDIYGTFAKDYLPLVKPEPKPTISIYTDKASYTAGEKMHLGMDVENPADSDQRVSAYIYLETPMGSDFTLIKRMVSLPAELDYSNPDFKVFPLPAIPSGTYTWHAILADPVTGTIISESEAKWDFVGVGIEEPIEIEDIAKAFPPITEKIEFKE